MLSRIRSWGLKGLFYYYYVLLSLNTVMRSQAEIVFHDKANVWNLHFHIFVGFFVCLGVFLLVLGFLFCFGVFSLLLFVCLFTKQTWILEPENCNLPSVKLIKMTSYQGENTSLNSLFPSTLVVFHFKREEITFEILQIASHPKVQASQVSSTDTYLAPSKGEPSSHSKVNSGHQDIKKTLEKFS